LRKPVRYLRAGIPLCGFIRRPVDARRRDAPYRERMQFPDSTFAALDLADEPLRLGRLLALAVALTLLAVSAGLLVGG